MEWNGRRPRTFTKSKEEISMQQAAKLKIAFQYLCYKIQI